MSFFRAWTGKLAPLVGILEIGRVVLMKKSVQQLQKDMDQALGLLSREAFFSFSPEEEKALETEGQGIRKKLEDIEGSFLTVGLLGGTGVGKSTIMNGLAGAEIASTSHRRPHTDRVLIYRHEKAVPVPAMHLGPVPWFEITHQSDAVQNILLCDLPDFDSLIGEHRERVMTFLEHLDLLVWVTSPEKYADARFYDCLRMVSKAQQNFYFVLNKVDLLFGNGSLPRGYDRLERMVQGFEKNIRENGIADPVIYAVSAEGAMDRGDSAPWNQFSLLKNQVFLHRNTKEIRAIKAVNLDVAVRTFMSRFEKEAATMTVLAGILEEEIGLLRDREKAWMQAGREIVAFWIQRDLRHGLLLRERRPEALVGAGYAVAVLLEWGRRDRSPRVLEAESIQVPEDLALSLRQRFGGLEDRLTRRLFQADLPEKMRDKVGASLGGTASFEDMMGRFSTAAAHFNVEPARRAFRAFRLVQYLVYGLPFAFFLLALGDKNAWQAVFRDPGLHSLLSLTLSLVQRLFDPKGLAALGSLALILLFFGIRFYRGYGKRLERRALKRADALGSILEGIWREKFEEILKRLRHMRDGVRARKETLIGLMKKPPA